MMFYYLNEGSKILASASIVINSGLCYWVEIPVRECFEVSILSFGVLAIMIIRSLYSIQKSTKKENQRYHDQIFNLLGREKMGIVAMTIN
jgi:hypothetical protein